MKFVMFPTENLVKKVMKKKRKERRIRNLLSASHTADEGSRFTSCSHQAEALENGRVWDQLLTGAGRSSMMEELVPRRHSRNLLKQPP